MEGLNVADREMMRDREGSLRWLPACCLQLMLLYILIIQGRPMSTVEPLRGTTDAGTQDRRRPRLYDASPSYDDHRKSGFPSPYPDEWTEDQKKKYFECFRTLAQPQKEQEAANGWSGTFHLRLQQVQPIFTRVQYLRLLLLV